MSADSPLALDEVPPTKPDETSGWRIASDDGVREKVAIVALFAFAAFLTTGGFLLLIWVKIAVGLFFAAGSCGVVAIAFGLESPEVVEAQAVSRIRRGTD